MGTERKVLMSRPMQEILGEVRTAVSLARTEENEALLSTAPRKFDPISRGAGRRGQGATTKSWQRHVEEEQRRPSALGTSEMGPNFREAVLGRLKTPWAPKQGVPAAQIHLDVSSRCDPSGAVRGQSIASGAYRTFFLRCRPRGGSR